MALTMTVFLNTAVSVWRLELLSLLFLDTLPTMNPKEYWKKQQLAKQ
jgi:hypothetical protein